MIFFQRKCLQKIKQITSQNDHNDHEIDDQFHRRIQASFRRKHPERIVCGMKQNTGDQLLSMVKDQYEHEPDQNCEYDLDE